MNVNKITLYNKQIIALFIVKQKILHNNGSLGFLSRIQIIYIHIITRKKHASQKTCIHIARI